MAIAGILNEAQIEQAKQRAVDIVNVAEVGAIKKEQFVFFAEFDGTRNDMRDIKRSGNPEDTNVAELYKQAYQVEKANSESHLVAKYYKGHGTKGSLSRSAWQPAQVTQEAINTAQLAYSEFAETASRWLKKHPNGEVTTAITSFSRGAAQAAIFSHLLYRDGLIDPETKKVLIPPGQVGVSAGLIFDPVTTGVDANVAFAPNVRNIVVPQAENEYRYFFKGVDYANQPEIKVKVVTGNHCNIGGGNGDDGLGNLHLEAATKFLQKSGLDIADVDVSRKVSSTQTYKVYDESEQHPDTFQVISGHSSRAGQWDAYSFFKENDLHQTPRLLEKAVSPASIKVLSDGTIKEFKLYNGQKAIEIPDENHEKAKVYLEEPPERALKKHPGLLGALLLKQDFLNEISSRPIQSQKIMMDHFDKKMVASIELGNIPSPPNLLAGLNKIQDANQIEQHYA